MKKVVKKVLSVLVSCTFLIGAFPMLYVSAEGEGEKWETLLSTNMDGFAQTSQTPAMGTSKTFKSSKIIDGITVNLNVVGGGAAFDGQAWYPGNYCALSTPSSLGISTTGAPAEMGTNVLFADLGWTKWPGNLVNTASGPTLEPLFLNKPVNIGEKIRITAWVYAKDVMNNWTSGSEQVLLEDQTTPFNVRMWANRPWAALEDVGYNGNGDIPDVTINKTMTANKWTEFVLEYEVTELNKSINQLNFSVQQESLDKPYPKALYLSNVKVERLVEAKGSYNVYTKSNKVKGTFNFKLDDPENYKDPKILIAAYKDGLMLGVDIFDYDKDNSCSQFTIENAGTADSVRAYVWDYSDAAPIMDMPIDLKLNKVVEPITYSILGDSYSTFKGYLHPSTNLSYYPIGSSAVTSVDMTWWGLFANECDATLDANNSISGSTVCYDGYDPGTTDTKNISFVKRISDVGDPDLLIIEGGTNDSWAAVGLGEYKYDDFVEKDFETFRPALSYVLKTAKAEHPKARIIFMANEKLGAEFDESIRTICDYYGIKVLWLSYMDKLNGHPTPSGMIAIKNQLIKFLDENE